MRRRRGEGEDKEEEGKDEEEGEGEDKEEEGVRGEVDRLTSSWSFSTSSWLSRYACKCWEKVSSCCLS